MKAKRYIMNPLRCTVDFIRADLPIYLAILVYTIFALVLLEFVDGRHMAAHALYPKQWATMFLFLMPVIALAVEGIYVVHRFDKRRTLAFRRVYSTQRIGCMLSGMALLMGMMVFQGSFTSIKNVLPLLNDGFPYDVIHADIDAFIHFGADPWLPLHWLAGNELAKTLIEWNYNVLWFVFCFGALFFVVTSPQARSVRTRYIVMFMLVWVVCGNILAGLFLSAGPAFYGLVTGDNSRFGEMLFFLAGGGESSGTAYSFQKYLWSLHESEKAGFGSGISAFPSVHVALITMNAFFAAEFSRRLGLIAFAYTSLIVASSIYLGWHYAIDGYASILAVSALYLACKHLIPATLVRAGASGVDDAQFTSEIPDGVVKAS